MPPSAARVGSTAFGKKRDRRRRELTERLYVYMTPADMQSVRDLAAVAGMSVSEFAREAMLGIDIKPLPPRVPPVNAALYAELGRQGSNLNQIARAYNERSRKDPSHAETVNAINAVVTVVKKIRADLLGK